MVPAGFFLRGVVPAARVGKWRKSRKTGRNLSGGSVRGQKPNLESGVIHGGKSRESRAGHLLHGRYRTARTPGIDRSNALVVQLSPSETLNTIMAFDVAGIDEPRSKYCVHTTKG